MIIYDENSKRRLASVTLFLTPEESAEIGDAASDLSVNPSKHHHHVNSVDYLSEITIAVYTKENLKHFNAESQQLIRKYEDDHAK